MLDWKQPYQPATVTHKQLADDWRLFIAAVANLDAGKDEPFSYEDIYAWATDCLKEIAKRSRSEKMCFSVSEKKSESYAKLWLHVSKKLAPWELSILTKSLDSSNLPGVEFTDDADKDEKLAPVNPSGVELGEEITLDEVLPHFKSFYRTRPYVSIIGGLCTQGKTKGDIDIFINLLP